MSAGFTRDHCLAVLQAAEIQQQALRAQERAEMFEREADVARLEAEDRNQHGEALLARLHSLRVRACIMTTAGRTRAMAGAVFVQACACKEGSFRS